MNNKISNPKLEVPTTTEMNDLNCLSDVLETEKNMCTNLSIALNEASNYDLYEHFFDIYDNTREAQRNVYNLLFENGWYSLEKESQTKIDEKFNELSQKINELI